MNFVEENNMIKFLKELFSKDNIRNAIKYNALIISGGSKDAVMLYNATLNKDNYELNMKKAS